MKIYYINFLKQHDIDYLYTKLKDNNITILKQLIDVTFENNTMLNEIIQNNDDVAKLINIIEKELYSIDIVGADENYHLATDNNLDVWH